MIESYWLYNLTHRFKRQICNFGVDRAMIAYLEEILHLSYLSFV